MFRPLPWLPSCLLSQRQLQSGLVARVSKSSALPEYYSCAHNAAPSYDSGNRAYLMVHARTVVQLHTTLMRFNSKRHCWVSFSAASRLLDTEQTD
eukprot:6168220-Pleurochrysis_carterae.AAC.1